MKRQELKNKVDELIKNESFKKYLNIEVEKLIEGGYLNIESEESNSYGLAKLVLHLALRRLSEQYAPLSNYYRKEYRELLKNY